MALIKITQGNLLKPIHANIQQAYTLYEQGFSEQALQFANEILESQPRNAHAHYLAALIFRDASETGLANKHFLEASRCGLKDPGFLFQYATHLLNQQNVEAALKALNESLRSRPDFLQARYLRANLHFEMGSFELSAEDYLACIKLNGNAWEYHYNLGHTYHHLQNTDGALNAFQRAIDCAPKEAICYAALASQLEISNRLDESEAVLANGLAIDPCHPHVLLLRARLCKRRRQYKEAFSYLEKIIESDLDARTRVRFWNERAECLDAAKNYADAWQAYQTCKQALIAYQPLLGEPFRSSEFLLEKEKLFSEATCQQLQSISLQNELERKVAHISARPLFILGFNRSGTTLVEQMLACHSAVTAGDELEWLPEIERSLANEQASNYVANMQKLLSKPNKLQRTILSFRQHYIEQATAKGLTNTPWFTDKLPLNSLCVELIQALFPDALVVRMIRHPLDVILSNFFHIYLHRNEWSYSLERVTDFYLQVNEYLQTMMPKLTVPIIEVKYESLIEEPEPILRKILAGLKLEWDPRCLRFHENERVAKTASYAQINQPLNTQGRYRYRNYLEWIPQTVLEKVAPLAIAQGYQID